ncbi:hypothetical protein OU995_21245 [Roseateles sp. SL47]|uniref:hypothetical protein n=1 Tax=Roseateles sp. SL47 TaxID=2995138 RepID=UPI00226EE67A|nr:hypothetical protein [Roseateles sp. SL47]WAC72072.1 hypothetical protein OU995_21245 [Roseateles sp. SL47]
MNDWQGFKAGMTRDLGAALEAVAVGAGAAVTVAATAKDRIQALFDPNDGKWYSKDGTQLGGMGGGSVAVQQGDTQIVGQASALSFTGPLQAVQNVGAAGRADVTFTPQSVVTPFGVTGIPNYGGYHPFSSPRASNLPLVGFPKRKVLAMFFSPTSVNTVINSGNIGVNSDYTDPFVGETWNSANANYGGSATNGQSMRVSWIANSDIVVARAVENTVAYDVTGNNVYVQLKMLSGSPPGTMQIRLYTTGQIGSASANYWQAEVVYPFNATLKVGATYWQTLGVPASNFTAVGAPGPLTAVVTAGFRITSSDVGAMLVGNIFACPALLKRGAVIIGFDDCRQDTWTAAMRVMGSRGFPGVAYPGAVASVIRGTPDQYQMTAKQLTRLQNEFGWQIASQAWDTEAPTDSLPEFAAKMSAMRALYEAEGWRGGADGSYFSNVSMGSARDKVFRDAFRSMRSFNIYSAGTIPYLRPEVVPTPDPYNLQAFGVDTSIHTAAHMQGLVDKVIAAKGVMRFVFHGVAENTPAFLGLVDYLDAQRANVDVVTEAQLVDQQRGLAFS